MKAKVFNIERYATEDGRGIRTVVFLKGCQLRCRWCANPESQLYQTEILLNANTCIQCGKCEKACPQGAIHYRKDFGYITNAAACTGCRCCIDVCHMDARRMMGTVYKQADLLEEILKDEQYFQMSSGGVTFSGGEPLYYADTIREIACEMKKRSLTTLVETCGQVPLENIQAVADSVDYIYYDFKHYNPEKHKELTGYDNDLILKNLRWLEANYKGVLAVRYPYIPGCNSKEDDIQGFFDYIKQFINVAEVIFLPYHRLGIPKYQGLGRVYEMGNMKSLKKAEMKHLYELAAKNKIKIKIQ